MFRFLHSCFFLPSLLFWGLSGLSLLHGADQEAALDLTALKKAIEQRDLYESVHTEIVQEKTLPSLSEPLLTEGQLWLIPQASFRWEQGSPVTDIAIFNGEKIFLLNEEFKTMTEHKMKDRDIRPLMLLLGMGKGSTFKGLLENFKPYRTESTSSSFTVSFKPDSGLMKRALSDLTLTFDLNNSFPSEIIWKQKDGAIIRTSFKSPRFNTPLSPELFHFIPETYSYKD